MSDGRDMRVGVLGALRVQAAGREVDVSGPKRRLLLARLAAEAGSSVTLDTLIGDLWGERPPHAPRVTLQSHVSHLRQALGAAGSAVVTEPAGYRLDVRPEQVDAILFERTVAEAAVLTDPAARSTAFADALGVWRGSALQGLDDDWSRNEAARLEELRLQAIEDRVAADLELGRHRALVPELTALVQAHPLREHVWIQLMWALSGCGRHAEALRKAQELRTLLGEIGLSTSPEVGEAESAILLHSTDPRSSAPAVPVAPAPTARPGTTVEPAPSAEPVADRQVWRRSGALPFVGRGEQRARLEALAREARQDGPRFAFVMGPPGVGKSRLVEEVLGPAADGGDLVLFGRCDDDLDAPFQAYVDLASGYLHGVEPGAPADVRSRGVGWLVPAAAGAGGMEPLVDPDAERDRRFRDMAAWLMAEAARRPVVLVVEDVQWAALPSLQLTRHLVRHLRRVPILVLLTCRTSSRWELPSGHPVLLDIASDEAMTPIRVPSLSEAETVELLERWPEARRVRGADEPDVIGNRLWHRTGGNPLFLREVVRDLAESGASVEDDGRSEEVASEGPASVPHRIRATVDQRLARLSAPTVDLLERASVLGPVVEVPVLLLLAATSDHEVVAALDEATAAQLLEPVEGAGLTYRFSHVLVADALYERISVARRAMYHRDAGRAIEVVAGDGDLQRLAHHWSQAAALGESDRAIGYLRAAGREALAGGDAELALRHLRRAEHLLDRTRRDEDARGELLLELGEAERRVPGEDERATFLTAAAHARPRGDVGRLGRAAKGISRGFVILGPAADEERLDLLAEAADALAAAAPHDPLRPQVLAAYAGELRLARQDERSRAAVEHAVAVAREIGAPDVLVHALATRWDIELAPDRMAIRAAIVKELTEILEDSPLEPDVICRVAWTAFGNALEADDGDAAVAALAALLSAAARSADPRIAWRGRVARATWAIREGDAGDALALIDEAAATGSELGWLEVIAAQAAQATLVLAPAGATGELVARVPDVLGAIPAGQAAIALRDAYNGRSGDAFRTVSGLFGPAGLELPADATWPFGAAVLARVASELGHEPLARAVDRSLRLPGVVALAHPTYYAGTVAAARALVSPLL